MKLTSYSDYSMRVLLYLGARTEGVCSISEIAKAYGISQNHLMKVVHNLGKAGFITSVRGRSGGIRLAKPPEDIILGEVLRETEEDFALVDCQHCLIAGACGLACALDEAAAAFMAVLDSYTLADLISRRRQMVGLFQQVSALSLS